MRTELSRYESLLDVLEKSSGERLGTVVLEVLRIRNSIARAASDMASLTTDSLATLHKLDSRLRARAFYLQAESDLNGAIELRPDGAAAHCLLAQAYEARKKEALAEWQACVANAEGQRDEVESSWLGQTQERLLAVP